MSSCRVGSAELRSSWLDLGIEPSGFNRRWSVLCARSGAGVCPALHPCPERALPRPARAGGQRQAGGHRVRAASAPRSGRRRARPISCVPQQVERLLWCSATKGLYYPLARQPLGVIFLALVRSPYSASAALRRRRAAGRASLGEPHDGRNLRLSWAVYACPLHMYHLSSGFKHNP